MEQGQIPPPQNVSLMWINDFEVQLSWAPPENLTEDCKYFVCFRDQLRTIRNLRYKTFMQMDGSTLSMSVETTCDGTSSEAVSKNITYPDLVRNVKCYIHSFNGAHCSWLPASHAPALSFFYWFVREDLSTSGSNDHFSPSYLKECPSYSHNGTVRTGCDLQANITQAIYILFNGTQNSALVRNTFKKSFAVRPPRLNWEVTKTGEKFLISWSPPNISGLSEWKYTVNYSECNEGKVKTISSGTSTDLDLVPHCPYRIAIKASTSIGETPWSDEKYFDAEPNALVYASIIIPLVFAGLALLICVYYRKNRHNIFPKIPKPRDLLSDISDNNNQSTVRNLYVPAMEEDNCKITLVIDPQNNKVNS